MGNRLVACVGGGGSRVLEVESSARSTWKLMGRQVCESMMAGWGDSAALGRCCLFDSGVNVSRSKLNSAAAVLPLGAFPRVVHALLLQLLGC